MRSFSGIGNPDVCMGMSHAYKRLSINTFIHTHAYTVIHAYHLVVHAYSCIHPMPICHAYQSGYKQCQASWPHAYIHGCNACIHAYTHLYSDAHTHSYLCIPKQIPPNFIHTMLTYYLPCPGLHRSPSPLRRRCRRCWCRPRLSVMPASSRPLPSLFPTCLHSHEYRRGPNFGIQALR